MTKHNQNVLGKLNFEIRQIGNKYRNNLLEWNHVNLIIEKEILPILIELYEEQVETLACHVSRLQAKSNQFSFRNDPERDSRIITLFDLGYSRGRIAKEVGMSKWGVSKALRRLGVN
jgi:c-di-AMP phosphodiesterase-like protein